MGWLKDLKNWGSEKLDGLVSGTIDLAADAADFIGLKPSTVEAIADKADSLSNEYLGIDLPDVDIPDDLESFNQVQSALEVEADLKGLEGFNEFRAFVEDPANQGLVNKVTNLLGVEEGAGQDTMEMLESLQDIANADPNVFKNLNTVVNAQGFEGFVDTLQQNEALMEMMQGDGGPIDPKDAANLIGGLAERVNGSEEPYFDKASNFLTERAGMISTAGGLLAGGSGTGGDPLAMLDTGMEMNESFGGILDFFSGIWDSIMEFLEPFIEGIKGFISDIGETLGLTEAKVTSNPEDDLAGKVSPHIQPDATLGPDGKPVVPTPTEPKVTEEQPVVQQTLAVAPS
jgi:hypothetical protein